MLGSDLLSRDGLDPEVRRTDPRTAPKKAAVMDCPFTGGKIALVPAIRTDFCLLHVQKASAQGLLRIEGQEFLDVQQAMAAKTVIATCEELLPDEELRREPERNRLPPFAVHAVVHLPWGAHPHSVHNCYDYDPEHLTEFSRLAKSDETFREYLDRYVFGAPTHESYLAAVGGEAKLSKLRARSGLGYNPELRRKGES
jgi:glutaconate CoA-transferase subunit A